ncbi:peptide chain release factor N(5)-glutamine methyltransferase [Parashewanella curva]|uniref:Release factor glutamine methyltransferase n=1 Tax=Parashewanella curva TaxID=2338552 RepID=A0A3L8Q0A9_9GAMM|nr:peptide chain release factor N(5)-glutamine methyltransferase [Parashewanella curva]RLV60213.1 peptide chain release factor N(5)-glutamine methyltransferase [Parashewanella curva]
MTKTIAQALSWASEQLAHTSESASLDAEVCLMHVLNKNRTYLYTWPDKTLSDTEQTSFHEIIVKREQGHPVAHIVGEREFWSLPLLVNATTLIPRPDTEILVETALTLPLPEQAKVLDLGTGTGAIALALASEKPNWHVMAVDKVEDAVKLAQTNQGRLQLNNVTIKQSDWFSAVEAQTFDLIVSNPPYIDEQDEHLTQGDVRFEPLSALTAPNEGFADLFHIADIAKNCLNPNGFLLMEHGYQQGEKLRHQLTKLGYSQVKTIKDFGNNERCTLGKLK